MLFQSTLALLARCITHRSLRTAFCWKLTTPFQIVLQQMLTDAEVSSQEGCIQKVGELVCAFSPPAQCPPEYEVICGPACVQNADSRGIRTDACSHCVAVGAHFTEPS